MHSKLRMEPFRINTQAWELIFKRVEAMREQGKTLAEIGRLLSVNKSTVQRWLDDKKGGERTSFRDMLRYLDRLGISLHDVFGLEAQGLPEPSPSPLSMTRLDVQVARTLDTIAKVMGHSPEQLAAAIGATPVDVAAMLSAKRAISAGDFYRLCKAVGMAPTELLERAATLSDDIEKGGANQQTA